MGQREAEQRERPIYGRSPLSPRPFAAQYESQRNAPRRSFSHERPTRSPPDAGPTCPGNSRQLQATARTRSMWTFPTRGHHPAGSGAPRPGPRRGFASWMWGAAEAGDPTVFGRPSLPVHLARRTLHVTQWNPMRHALQSYTKTLGTKDCSQKPRPLVLHEG